MAQVRYQDVPEVAPAENAPQDEQHIQANPEEFGGAIAKGAEQLGQGASNAAKFFGEVQADDATNTALTRANAALNKFRALNGADALNAQKPTQDEIDAAFKDGRDSLSTPAQQYQYDSNVRNYQQRYISGIMASHADEQAKAFAGKTNKDAFDLAVNSVAGAADKPDAVLALRDDARKALIQQLQIEGNAGDAGARKDAIAKADQAVAKAQIQAISVNDPARAERMVENYKAILGTDYAPMAASVRNRADLANGIGLQRKAVSDTYGNLPPPATAASLPAVQSAIYGQESSSGKRTETSVTGAAGPMQIEPATFQQYARPGENIANKADNKIVGDRIINDYYTKYNGDPYRIAVAYFSGPGNVAPPGSATPWLNNKADPTGKTVASYVSDVAAKLGVSPIAPYTAQAAAERQIMLSDASDEVKQHALAENARFFRESEIAMEASAKEKKQVSDTARDAYVTQVLTNQDPKAGPALLSQIAADPHLEGPTKEALYNLAQKKYGLEDDATQYGSAYADTYKRIFLPPGDPNRINDPNEILQMGAQGGGLTTHGVGELYKVYQASKKDPDQSSVNQVKSSLINYAKQKLSFDQETLFPGVNPLRDPKGVQIFDAQFVPKFEAAYDAWVKGGKNPWEFLTQENVDKLMVGMRPKGQMAADRISAEGQATGEPLAAAPPPPAPEGVTADTWGAVLKSPPQMATGQMATPKQYGDAIALLEQNPTPEFKTKFNKWFGQQGAMADDILGKLHPQKEAPKPEGAAPIVVPPAPQPSLSDSERQTQDDREAERLANEARERQGAIAQRGQERRAGLLQ